MVFYCSLVYFIAVFEHTMKSLYEIKYLFENLTSDNKTATF